MKIGRIAALWAMVVGSLFGFASLALANGPEPGGLGLLKPVTPVAEEIQWFHTFVMIIITIITIFVTLLLAYVMVRFRASANPTPSKTTHNTLIEVLWTVIPIIILVVIAVPSFKLLYFADRIENADLTIKAIGKQWYWSFEYPDNGAFTFDSYMVEKEDLPADQKDKFLLVADNALVLPVDTNIRILVTAGDVLHNFAMPQFGIKLDAVPGRINETWTIVPGKYAGETFYGQCSELCGTGHSYMPITVQMVTKAEFAAWTEKAREEFAQIDTPETRVRLVEAGGGKTE